MLNEDMEFHIGESTLETLPGTVTPPTAIYSPLPKLTDSCIQDSCTSTPLNFSKALKLFTSKTQLFTAEIELKLKALANKRQKKVTFDTDIFKEMNRKVEKLKKRSKSKNITDKNMYRTYYELKNGNYEVIDTTTARGLKIEKRVNEGDLII